MPAAIDRFQIAVRGRDQPNVDLERSFEPMRVISPFSSTRSSLVCSGQRHVADFVEEQRAAVGVFELALAQSVGAGEGARLRGRTARLQQVLVQGGAVQGHERLVLARAVVVDRLGDQFLAGAVLAEDQDGGVGRRVGLAAASMTSSILGAGTDDALEAEAFVELLAQFAQSPVRGSGFRPTWPRPPAIHSCRAA